jgi:RHS repeat-associated protein
MPCVAHLRFRIGTPTHPLSPHHTPYYTPQTLPGSQYSYTYNDLSQLNTMTDSRNTVSMLTGITYNVAGQMTGMTVVSGAPIIPESRSYNSLGQLTSLSASTSLNITYAYSSTQNNGKITSQTDNISGEQVVYTYDALNRLLKAETATNAGVTQWGQQFTYDGFGNLTDTSVTKGSAPSFSTTYSASTNRRTGDTADSNGNITYVNSQYLTYDIENRISGVGTYSGDTSIAQYGYDAGNKRVWRGGGSTDELTFWAPNGQKLGTYNVKYDTLYSSGYYLKLSQTWVYFGGKMVSKGVLNLSNSTQDKVDLSSVIQDRLGSRGKYYPYGIERPSASANDTEKFATYTRDSATGLDYAVNRYEQPGYGRFLSPDPYKASAGLADPGSWNRYAYVQGDPVNNTDSSGLLLDRLDCYFCDQPIGFGGSDDSTGRRIQYSNDLDVFYAYHTQTADGGWVCNSNIQTAFTTATANSPGWSCGPPVTTVQRKKPNWAMFVVAISDCTTINVGSLERVQERRINYRAYYRDLDNPQSGYHALAGGVITEHLKAVFGTHGKEGSAPRGDIFQDGLSVGNTGAFEAIQTFTIEYMGFPFAAQIISLDGVTTDSNTLNVDKNRITVNLKEAESCP